MASSEVFYFSALRYAQRNNNKNTCELDESQLKSIDVCFNKIQFILSSPSLYSWCLITPINYPKFLIGRLDTLKQLVQDDDAQRLCPRIQIWISINAVHIALAIDVIRKGGYGLVADLYTIFFIKK